MSSFTESSFERKCAELNQSQQSIQSLSVWVVHHRKHAQNIVKVWYKEFIKAQEHRKLTFLYLANDVIQNSRRKGPEIGKAYAPTLKKAFEHMARIPGEKTKTSLMRILSIWKDRGIYEAPLLEDFEKTYLKAWDDVNTNDDDEFDLITGITTPPISKDVGDGQSQPTATIVEKTPVEPEKKKRPRRSKAERESSSSKKRRSLDSTNTVDEWEADGVVQLEVKLSPSPYTEPPTEDELFRLIKDMDKMPSTDAVTRGRIASLPACVSNIAGVEEYCVDSDAARSLQNEILDAYRVLVDYNRKLDNELMDRKKFSMKLQDFLHAQKDLLTQAEQRYEDHQTHEKVLLKKLDELKAHVTSMPDLTKLPTLLDGGLQPLPSAGDLFL